MKKYLFALTLFLVSYVGFSQKGISYQAVILDPNKIELPGQDITGQPLFKGDVWVKFGIYTGQNLQFEEVHKTKTDEYGLVNLLIGSLSSASFNSLIWDASQKNLQVNVSFNQGASYTKVSDQKLYYVPYSLYAESSGKFVGILPISGGGTGASTPSDARANLGLDKVDNTSDLAKPISTATQIALNQKASLESPSLTGVPSAPTALAGSNSTQLATTAFVNNALSTINSASLSGTVSVANGGTGLTSAGSNGQVLTSTNSGTLTWTTPSSERDIVSDADSITKGKIQLAGDLSGTAAAPTVPGLALKANTVDVTDALALKASAASVTAEITRATNAENALDTRVNSNTISITTNAASISLKAPLESPSLTGVPSAPTALAGSNSTQLATTAFVNNALSTINSASLSGTVSVANGGTGLTSAGSNGQVLTSTNSGTLTWTTPSSSGGIVADADATTKGKIQLAGDLSGTAAAPTVPGLALKANTVDVTDALALKASAASVTAEITRAMDAEAALDTRVNANSASITTMSNTLVPYTGADRPVDLGGFDLKVNGVDIGLGGGGLNTNARIGQQALFSNTTGYNNTASGNSAIYSNIEGIKNSATGAYALYYNTTGSYNTASGFNALSLNATGNHNTAIGNQADVGSDNLENATAIGDSAIVLASNTIQLGNTAVTNVNTSGTITAGAVTYPNVDGVAGQVLTTRGTGELIWETLSGSSSGTTDFPNDITVSGINIGVGGGELTYNTRIGYNSLRDNNTGYENTAIGAQTLYFNTGGEFNTATGSSALYTNSTGYENTANGVYTLYSNTTGNYNTAIGSTVLYYNSTGNYNSAIGVSALNNNTRGSYNSAIGEGALAYSITGSYNTAIGKGTLTSNEIGNHNTAIGNKADVGQVNLENATAIGDSAIVLASNTIQLGNTFVEEVITSGSITAGAVTYPNTHGTTGQVLTSTKSGTLTWTTPVFLPTIVIGTQQWMRENLDVLTYRNGDVIPQVTDPTAWANLTTGAWCFYNNDPLNGAIYGKIYNWYAVNDPRGLAPQGWHIPTDEEWTTLSTLLGGNTAAGGKMKTTGITRWITPNASATNESGFSGLPGGLRSDSNGSFSSLGGYTAWWSSTEVGSTNSLTRYLDYRNGTINTGNGNKKYGFSVRCLRD